jgi:glycosyltransferase involved in cell wall biosynthesis
MKVAVYTIAKDEEKFASRFMKSAREADVVIVADTGSTDDTVSILQQEGATVHSIVVSPWRFDLARNISLDLVPEDVDICVCIDLDEVLTPGWRKQLEEAWTKDTTQVTYQYVWNTLPDGKPGVTFWYDKIHARFGYRWVNPVHEILKYDSVPVKTQCEKFTLFHYPDKAKVRNYLPLLEMACKENPDNDRNSHYLGREYMYNHQWINAITELKRHLSLPSATWDAERCASMRFIARCYSMLDDQKAAKTWALKACTECPETREPWLDLAKIYNFQQNWAGVLFAVDSALKIKERPKIYINEPECWGVALYDYGIIASYNLKMYSQALAYCEQAHMLDPKDARILANLNFMRKNIQSK